MAMMTDICQTNTDKNLIQQRIKCWSVLKIVYSITLTIFLLSVLLATIYIYVKPLTTKVMVLENDIRELKAMFSYHNITSSSYINGKTEEGVPLSYRNKRGTKNKGKNNDDNKNKKRRKKRNNNGISFVHIVIDKRHPKADRNREELLTGDRGQIIPYWKYSDSDVNINQNFGRLTNDGVFKIRQSGIYMIYSQMTYFDRTGRWSHSVAVNNLPFIKCLASEWGITTDPDTGLHYNTVHQCYTSAVIKLNNNDVISILGMYPDRVIHSDKDMSYWGLTKLS